MTEERYAVIGESEGYPVLYHMNQRPLIAEQLRKRRETTIGQPCFVVPMAAWLADPLQALHRAEGALREGGRGASRRLNSSNTASACLPASWRE